MRTVLWFIFLSATSVARVAAQQPDTAFRHTVGEPSFAPGEGPAVCIDGAHANLHTMDGTYRPFATLLEEDGYTVRALVSAWSKAALAPCALLVVSNALAPANLHDRSLPHASAFSKPELDTISEWLSAGGALLLVADHEPFPGAVRDLGLILGVHMLDAFAAPGDSGAVIAIFGETQVSDSVWRRYASDRGLPFRPIAGAVANPGSLGAHPIMIGRRPEEGIRWVLTFTGHAFQPSDRVAPLLLFGPRAIAVQNRPDAAAFPVGGWLQAGALQFGDGRAVVLGEASTCTAHVGGPRGIRTGMNTPEAPDNAQFCLNIVRWLTRVLD